MCIARGLVTWQMLSVVTVKVQHPSTLACHHHHNTPTHTYCFSPCRAPPPPLPQDVGGSRQVVPEVLSTTHLGPAVGRTGRAIVGVSGGGEYVSVCWPASRGYVVYYRTLAGTWQEVESGSGVDLAWHSHR